MKGLEASLIWMMFIAVVSVVILVTLISESFRPAANRIYCDIYLRIARFFSGSGTSSLPTSCKIYSNPPIQVVEIRDQDKTTFSRNLLSYIITCWKETEIQEFYKTHTCYEVRLTKTVQDVSEQDLTDVLSKEDQCKSIENSDFGCGAANQILWEIGENTISNQKIILIEYNQDKEAIRVIG